MPWSSFLCQDSGRPAVHRPIRSRRSKWVEFRQVFRVGSARLSHRRSHRTLHCELTLSPYSVAPKRTQGFLFLRHWHHMIEALCLSVRVSLLFDKRKVYCKQFSFVGLFLNSFLQRLPSAYHPAENGWLLNVVYNWALPPLGRGKSKGLDMGKEIKREQGVKKKI